MAYSEDDCIEALQKAADQLDGETFTISEYRELEISPGSTTIINRFGTWNKSLEVANISINRKRNISKSECLESLQHFYNKEQCALTIPNYNQLGYSPGSTTIVDNFGSWNGALKSANIPVNRIRNVSKEDCVRSLRKFFNNESCELTHNNYKYSDYPYSVTVILNRFNSWNNALKAAGICINRESNISKIDCVRSLRKFFNNEDYELSCKNYKFSDYAPTVTTIVRKFGSWNNALEAAGLESKEQHPSGEKNYMWKGGVSNSYGLNWEPIRTQSLERDGGCVVCGRRYQLNGRDVDVHHIVPVKEFEDKNDSHRLNNTITLCKKHHGEIEHSGIDRYSTSIANYFMLSSESYRNI